MKPVVLTAALFCILSSTAIAQKYYTTTLRKANGQEVFTLDSADFISVISEPDSGSNLYNVKEFYKDKTPKLIGKSKNYKEIEYEGLVQTFYPTGKKHEMFNYVDGEKVGDSYEYYPNGKIYTHKKYTSDKKGNGELLLDCRDSTGTVLASGGEGKWRVYDNNFSYVFEEGTVKNGLRDGEWKGDNNDKAHNIIFTEQYEAGKLKSGKATYADDGKTYDYTVRYIDAQYPGGLAAFSRYLENKVVYPPMLRSNRTQGRVIVQFSVLPDGSLDEEKIVQSPDVLFSNEAMKVVKSSPKWTPAYAFGKPTKATYTVPVNFSM